MGLDMYLTGKRYMSKFYNDADPEKQSAIQILFPELDGLVGNFGDSPVKELRVEMGYWRKANAIHDWFVKNCQGGNDDCGYYYVGREQLLELKAACEQVLAAREQAPELLPTASGFFFGSQEYDKYYFEDLESTIRIIDECLTLPAEWDFEYHSSW